MLNRTHQWLALLGSALLLTAMPAVAQDSGPLVDLLVKKGIVTDQEAEELRADLLKDFAGSAAGKLNLSASATEFRISGDIRARYEDRAGQLPSGDVQQRDRFRYRFRTLFSGKLLNNWAWGFRLETADGSRSSNVTMGDDAGPFAKNSDKINIGQIYLTWTPSPVWNVTVGRMPNPLVTTSMVWDGDINPEGLAEQFRLRQDKLEYFGTAAQFLYSSAGTQNVFSGAAGSNVKDLFLFAWQGGLKYYTGEGVTDYFQVAPTIYQYVGADQRANPAAFKGVFTASNAAPINNLFVFDLPIEYNWVAGGVPIRVFGDYAFNIDGDARARKFGRPDLDGQSSAYTVGVQYGKASLPGEWDASVAWQSVGAFALDPNLVDSDLFDSRTNMQGWWLKGDYALGAATQITLTLANAKRAKDVLIAPGSGDIGSNNALDEYWLFQADLNVKF